MLDTILNQQLSRPRIHLTRWWKRWNLFAFPIIPIFIPFSLVFAFFFIFLPLPRFFPFNIIIPFLSFFLSFLLSHYFHPISFFCLSLLPIFLSLLSFSIAPTPFRPSHFFFISVSLFPFLSHSISFLSLFSSLFSFLSFLFLHSFVPFLFP